jgi:protoheme IX farnesyltransferase
VFPKKSYQATSVLRLELVSRLSDYVMLIKLRLSIVVVMSSLLGYMIAANGDASMQTIGILLAGGFLVTSAANALNQVLEKDFDILMSRTANRPVATGRMKSSEAVMFAGIACVLGTSLLASLNALTALLGMLSMMVYAFVYTPLKRYNTLAVPVGAIPGALPVLIGAAAVDGKITMLAFCLFVIQFLWQFPHFWSIGFLAYDDYKNAGYKLLPEQNGRIDRNLGLSSMFYAMLVIPVALFMYIRLDVSLVSTCFTLLLTMGYILLSYRLHAQFNKSAALKLMLFSFFYLPLILLSYWLI